jgi:hypothetical protein
MDLEETEARNGCAGEDQHQFDRPTDPESGGSTFLRNVGELHRTTRYHIRKLPFIAQWPTVP